MTNLEKIRKDLSPSRRKTIDKRAAELIEEELTFAGITQGAPQNASAGSQTAGHHAGSGVASRAEE